MDLKDIILTAWAKCQNEAERETLLIYPVDPLTVPCPICKVAKGAKCLPPRREQLR